MKQEVKQVLWTGENIIQYKSQQKKARRAKRPPPAEKKRFICSPVPRHATLEQLQLLPELVTGYREFTIPDGELLDRLFAYGTPVLSVDVMEEQSPGICVFDKRRYSIEEAMIRNQDKGNYTKLMDRLGYDVRSDAYRQFVKRIFP